MGTAWASESRLPPSEPALGEPSDSASQPAPHPGLGGSQGETPQSARAAHFLHGPTTADVPSPTQADRGSAFRPYHCKVKAGRGGTTTKSPRPSRRAGEDASPETTAVGLSAALISAVACLASGLQIAQVVACILSTRASSSQERDDHACQSHQCRDHWQLILDH
ncbi:hypothetical protein V5799_029980 [Amblyomma americanum]|uniref:Uncharacterized protein n=1 Tax=Amblyomma americanum TaxID=6943 RepID=A0AAQ4EPP5_AMBAM